MLLTPTSYVIAMDRHYLWRHATRITKYVSMTLHNLVIPWDFIANIDQQQNIGQGKSYWPSGPYNCLTPRFVLFAFCRSYDWYGQQDWKYGGWTWLMMDIDYIWRIIHSCKSAGWWVKHLTRMLVLGNIIDRSLLAYGIVVRSIELCAALCVLWCLSRWCDWPRLVAAR